MKLDIGFIQVFGIVLIYSLAIIGLAFWLGVLAVKYDWSLRLVLGIPPAIGVFIIFLFFWLMDRHNNVYLVIGTVGGIGVLFNGFFEPPIVVNYLKIWLARYAGIKTQEEKK